jgi:hypothetical protein
MKRSGGASAAVAPPATPTEHISPRMELSYRRPASISVIAVFLLTANAPAPLVFLYPRSWRMIMFFGVMFAGREMLVVTLLWAVVAVVLGIGLLRLRAWARIGAIAYCLAGIVNNCLTIPHIGHLMFAMSRAMGVPAPPISPNFLRWMTILGAIVGLALYLTPVYFLITRVAAFGPGPSTEQRPRLSESGAKTPW